jgi:hypothetical protein
MNSLDDDLEQGLLLLNSAYSIPLGLPYLLTVVVVVIVVFLFCFVSLLNTGRWNRGRVVSIAYIPLHDDRDV